MVAGCAINYVVGLIALITFIFNVGPIDDSLMVYGGQPWVAVMYRITGSKAATIVLLVLMSICVRMTARTTIQNTESTQSYSGCKSIA